jgi:MipA family protein
MGKRKLLGWCWAMVLGLAGSPVADIAAAEPDDQPLWEIGAVAGGGWLPDYPASSQNHTRVLALPYAIYRGEIFRVGERGAARGIVYDDQRIEIDLGLDAAFAVDSDDNNAREGMPNLDYLLELGQRVRYRFLPEPDGHELDASLAVRGVVSTDFANWRYQGVTINPAVSYRVRPLPEKEFRLVATLSPFWGVDGLNKYFYEVKPRFERDDRPAYQADNGYIGTELNLGATWGPWERVRVFGGVQLGYWEGSANEDSPLYREDFTVAVGGGLRVALFRSESRVARGRTEG